MEYPGTGGNHTDGLNYASYDHLPSGYVSGSSLRSRTASPFVGGLAPSTPQSDGGSRTRNGRQAGNKKSPSPRTRKGGAKTKTPKINAPLSVLTKDMSEVPVRDMQAWVNRSAEDRLEEVKSRGGYITRPMNSFMLYRSAYSERTKAWCAENNHQVVSSVSGESWPMESTDVRNFYNELAKIERHNHHAAHPQYKFSPAKPGRKRKATNDSSEDELSDGDPDGEWNPRTKRAKSRCAGREAGYPANSQMTAGISYDTPRSDPFAPSEFEPGVYGHQHSAAAAVQPPLGPNPFFHPTGPYPYMMQAMDGREYNLLNAQPYPFLQPMMGPPSHTPFELQQLHSQSSTPIPLGLPTDMQLTTRVDPSLLTSHSDLHSIHIAPEEVLAFSPVGAFPAPPPIFYDMGVDPTQHQHALRSASLRASSLVSPLSQAYPPYRPEAFAPESMSPTFNGPSEFDSLFAQGHLEESGSVGGVAPRDETVRSPVHTRGSGPKGSN